MMEAAGTATPRTGLPHAFVDGGRTKEGSDGRRFALCAACERRSQSLNL